MSHRTYDEKWRETQILLAEILEIEPIQADRREQRNLLSLLYVRYILAANRFSACIDQMVQPQKRQLIRKLLEAILGRVLELKNDLVEADLNEWTHCGNILTYLGITPIQSELHIPECFRKERIADIEYKKSVVDGVLDKLGYLEKPQEKPPMSEQHAILIIQSHERARQGRLRTQFMKELSHSMKEKKTFQDDDGEETRGGISLSAAMRIQTIWRGYVARRMTKRRKLQEMLLIGMVPAPKVESEDMSLDSKTKNMRYQLQSEYEINYREDVIKCKNDLEKNKREAMLEQLTDHVRSWLYDYRKQTGKIPDYTDSERTTSRLLMSRQGTESDTSKSTPTSSKDAKSKKGKTSKEGTKSAEDDAAEEDTTKATISLFLPQMNIYKDVFNDLWKNKDESKNPRQKHYQEIIEQEQILAMENDLRTVVDTMIKAELILLQEAMDRDRGHKTKKKASKRTRKGGKKSKKKKEKDLTPDRTTESLFEELVANGIIKKYPETYLSDFKGERSYNNCVPHNTGKVPAASLGDVRQIIAEYCVLPLLTDQLHENSHHIKSVMIVGHKGSGKDMLVHAICTEAGAVLFDLTPSNIVGKYSGKTGLTMLIHLVTKVSRLLQPSVIYMDNAEKPFVKKIPKTDKSDPKRLKKDLPKIIKNFSVEERVLLVGASSCPWESDQKLLQQVYQKYLVIPKPNYSSRYCVWNALCGEYSAINWQFDTSIMSKISDGYTIGSIVCSFKEVMTVKRMLQLRIHPLSTLEVVNCLCKQTPIFKEEEEALEIWWSKSPMSRRRTKAIEALLEEQAEVVKQANSKN